jgi:branched-chain amino acid aminotransferase
MKITTIQSPDQSRIHGVDWANLGFGVYFSDHIFIMEHQNGAWGDERIEPYMAKPVEPGMCTLHYGQTIFEGMKAYLLKDGNVNLFRPTMNAKRMNRSAAAVCIPTFDEELFVEGIRQLVRVDYNWIPKERGHSLYLRPVAYGTENFLGVRASSEYVLIHMTSPVASYYPEGVNPVRIKVEEEHVRAVRGGLGQAKTAANYAASILAGSKAKKDGFAQVLFLDAIERKYVEEVGTMNMMFIINDELITPPLSQGSILAGVTRDSVLALARHWGMNVNERMISIDEVMDAAGSGKLQEGFGTGTAAVISPVGELVYRGKSIRINDAKIGPVAQKLYDTITGIQYGEIEDPFGWTETVKIV